MKSPIRCAAEETENGGREKDGEEFSGAKRWLSVQKQQTWLSGELWIYLKWQLVERGVSHKRVAVFSNSNSV